MPVVDVKKDLDAFSLTIVADFAAPVERVWQIYADPRQRQRVWGPPEYPVTSWTTSCAGRGDERRHDRPRGRARSAATGGSATCPSPIRSPSPTASRTRTSIRTPTCRSRRTSTRAHDGGTRATFVATYPSAEALQQVLDMGMIEGATAAMGQIDAFLAA